MPPTRATLWPRFLAITLPFFRSENRWRIAGLLGVLLALILCLNALNVSGSFMCRNFTTSVAERLPDRAATYAVLWLGIIAGLTVVAVFKQFSEERLRLWWREWLTRYLYDRYLSQRAYHRMRERTDVDNPDQRITEDVKTFTEQTLALALIGTNSTITLLSFAGILWSITPWLFLAAVLYTLFGSVMTILVGRRLLRLDVLQFRKEADLRYDLIQVRNHGEPIALLAAERHEENRLSRRLAAVVHNMKAIIGLSRNINFLTIGYDSMVQLIPLLIVAPLCIWGGTEIGAMAQAQLAFMAVMGAFSIVVKEFQRISTFGAVVERLGKFLEVLDDDAVESRKSSIEISPDSSRVAFENLTLVTPREGRLLVKDLSLQVPRGSRLLIVGPSGSGRTSLLRAIAGLWTSGQGRIHRPPLEDLLFLPQKPYLRSGCLRDQLVYGSATVSLSDERITRVLQQIGLGPMLDRVGGLNAERDWSATLSQGEQQRIAFAGMLLASPRFAFLDEATKSIDGEDTRRLYDTLAVSPITYITVAGDARLREYHDHVLEFGGDGSWTVTGLRLACA
jgi:putative ATP-binding cassette transporter